MYDVIRLIGKQLFAVLVSSTFLKENCYLYAETDEYHVKEGKNPPQETRANTKLRKCHEKLPFPGEK